MGLKLKEDIQNGQIISIYARNIVLTAHAEILKLKSWSTCKRKILFYFLILEQMCFFLLSYYGRDSCFCTM